MSRFGNTLFSGSRFIFWPLGVVLIVGGVSFFGLALWAFPETPQQIGSVVVGAFCLLLAVGLGNPQRFRLLSRVITGLVFGLYLIYVLLEWRPWFAQGPRHGADVLARPLRSITGMMVIGLPSLYWTIFGRFSMREPKPVPSEPTQVPQSRA